MMPGKLELTMERHNRGSSGRPARISCLPPSFLGYFTDQTRLTSGLVLGTMCAASQKPDRVFLIRQLKSRFSRSRRSRRNLALIGH